MKYKYNDRLIINLNFSTYALKSRKKILLLENDNIIKIRFICHNSENGYSYETYDFCFVSRLLLNNKTPKIFNIMSVHSTKEFTSSYTLKKYKPKYNIFKISQKKDFLNNSKYF